MKPVVIVPHTPSRARVAALGAIWAQCPDALFVELPEGDSEAYARCLYQAFLSRRAFCVVEHDVVPPQGAIEALLSCAHPWCGHAYPNGSGVAVKALGLSAFAAGLYDRYSGSIDWALQHPRQRGHMRHWSVVSEELALRLSTAGLCWHRHLPDAEHLHEYDQLEEE